MIGRSRIPLETRKCACGCKKEFICKINSLNKYVIAGHSRKSKHNSIRHNNKIGRANKISLKKYYKVNHPWNYNKDKYNDIRLKNAGLKISKCKKGVSTGKKSHKTIRNILKAIQAKPNKFEIRALTYLNAINKYKFKYTGDGSLIVNHKSADAYCKKLKTVALFHGIYWHWRKHNPGLQINEVNRHEIERKDSLPFNTR